MQGRVSAKKSLLPFGFLVDWGDSVLQMNIPCPGVGENGGRLSKEPSLSLSAVL